MLNEQEKQSIQDLKKTIEFYNKKPEKIISVIIDNFDVDILNTVLNLITKLQKENEILKRAFDKQTADMSNNLLELQQKDKIIDLMAEVMFKSNKAQLLIEYGIENKEQIIKEFEKLVKEKGE